MSDDRTQRHGVGAARFAVQRCDLADEITDGCMPKAQLAAFFGHDGKPHPTLRDQVKTIADLAAREQHLALRKWNFAKGRRANGDVLALQSLKEIGLRE